MGAGGAILAGVGTPGASAAVIGTMAAAGRTVHASNGYFVINEGYEYVLAVASAAAALAALGAGRFSVDSLLGQHERLSGPRGSLDLLPSDLAAPRCNSRRSGDGRNSTLAESRRIVNINTTS